MPGRGVEDLLRGKNQQEVDWKGERILPEEEDGEAWEWMPGEGGRAEELMSCPREE